MKNNKIFYTFLVSIILSSFVSNSYAILGGSKKKFEKKVTATVERGARAVVESRIKSTCQRHVDGMIDKVIKVLKDGAVFKGPADINNFRKRLRDFLEGHIPTRVTEIMAFLQSLGIFLQ